MPNEAEEAKPAIKPGDTVRCTLGNGREETWSVAHVENGRLYWSGWPPGCVEVERVTLVESCSPEEERATILRWAQYTPGRGDGYDPRHAWAKAEALRRGWRPLERGDLTPVTIRTELYDPAGSYLGSVERLAATYRARHTSLDCTHPSVSGLDSYEDAVDVILAVENARRTAAAGKNASDG